MKKILICTLTLIALNTLAISDENSMAKARAKEFIDSNLLILTKEIALGHGESIDTLAELLSIKDTSMFITFLQENYKDIDSVLNTQTFEEVDNVSSVDMQLTTN